METLVFREPTLHAWMFVGRIVVADDVDLFFGVDPLIDQAQKRQPLLIAMALLAQTSRNL